MVFPVSNDVYCRFLLGHVWDWLPQGSQFLVLFGSWRWLLVLSSMSTTNNKISLVRSENISSHRVMASFAIWILLANKHSVAKRWHDNDLFHPGCEKLWFLSTKYILQNRITAEVWSFTIAERKARIKWVLRGRGKKFLYHQLKVLVFTWHW